jgi:lysophospholipase L1-like esterase
MRKYVFCLILSVCLPLAASAADAGAQRWEKEISAFEASDKTNPPPQNAILFLGSSSIRKWNTLAHDFPMHKVINRGFGGSEISDSVYYFDRVVLPYKPKVIVFYAGSNDINARKSPETVVSDFREFLGKVEKELPDTKIDFISIDTSPSRWKDVEKVKTANHDIEAMAQADPKLQYIDTFYPLLDSAGKPRPELYVKDRLHLSPKGYAIWTSVIGAYLGAAN